MKKILFNEALRGQLEGDFNIFRENYKEFSFKQLQDIHDAWFNKTGGGKSYFTFSRLNPFFTYIHSKNLRVNVFEFGCWTGALAVEFLKSRTSKFILKYVGCDLCDAALSACNPFLLEREKFQRKYLDKQLWDYSDEEYDMKQFDVFISSHTLEHIKEEELKKLLEKIRGVRFLILELPFDPWEKWKDYVGNHMLETSPQGFIKLLYQYGWDLIEMIPNTFPESRSWREARSFLFDSGDKK